MTKRFVVHIFCLCALSLLGLRAEPLMAQDACALLSQADINKTTGVTVGNGEAGKAIPGRWLLEPPMVT